MRRPRVQIVVAWWETILRALWLFLPCYVANMAPVFAAKVIPRWKTPMDGGRMHKDGRPLLGPNKTWRGLAAAMVVAAAMAVALSYWAGGIWSDLGFGAVEGNSRIAIAAFGAALGFMALLGDAIKSYAKRRTGREGGAPWFPFDQLDFVIFGLLGAALASPLLPGWALHAYFGDVWLLVTLILLTPAMHFVANVIGYLLGLKKVWW